MENSIGATNMPTGTPLGAVTGSAPTIRFAAPYQVVARCQGAISSRTHWRRHCIGPLHGRQASLRLLSRSRRHRKLLRCRRLPCRADDVAISLSHRFPVWFGDCRVCQGGVTVNGRILSASSITFRGDPPLTVFGGRRSADSFRPKQRHERTVCRPCRFSCPIGRITPDHP